MQTKELLEPLSIKSRPLTNLTSCDRKFHKNKHSDRQTMRFIQSRSNANFAGPMFESDSPLRELTTSAKKSNLNRFVLPA